MSPPDTVFFFSDFGLRDEFVGVVHAVIRRLAPGVTVIDLTHEVRSFDVRGGGLLLARVMEHLGPGVVLGVVDPGVGGARRGVVVGATAGSESRWFIGPDNGLLMAAAQLMGEVDMAVELSPSSAAFGFVSTAEHGSGHDPPAGPAIEADAAPEAEEPAAGTRPVWSGPVSFDGRDLFAPAAAALCRGVRPEELGSVIDPSALIRLAPPVLEHGVAEDGRRCVRAEVVWVDRFGNVKLSVPVDEGLARSMPSGSALEVSVRGSVGLGGPGLLGKHARSGNVLAGLRAVRTFADLGGGELGVMADADGHLALVAREASAAMLLDLGAGDLVELYW